MEEIEEILDNKIKILKELDVEDSRFLARICEAYKAKP